MKILFVGGGTLGPVTPLLAVAEAMKRMKPGMQFVWIGTTTGPERALVEGAGIEFHALPVVKWPRYPSVRWLSFPFDWWRVSRVAKNLLKQLRPDAVATAGGFTAVPVVRAAVRLGIPCATHQLDLIPGLANKLIVRFCGSVTTSFEYERAPFGDRVSDERIPTPTRFAEKDLPTRKQALEIFGLDAHKPVVFIFGGGTGTQALNEFVVRTKRHWLEFAQLIQMTGVDRGVSAESSPSVGGGYTVHQFLDEKHMAAAYAASDLIVCRAGMGTLSEIASLKKASILIPIPHSHQECNACAFEAAGAAVLADQSDREFDEQVLTIARLLLGDQEARRSMGEKAHQFLPTDDGSALANRVLRLVEGIRPKTDSSL